MLVCNVGVCVLEDFLEDDTFENRDLHLDINVKGAWNVAKAVIPSMIANGGGAIVVTSSVTGDMVADSGEVGELAAFLGCYESSYITGTQIVIDGGSTLPETTSMGQ